MHKVINSVLLLILLFVCPGRCKSTFLVDSTENPTLKPKVLQTQELVQATTNYPEYSTTTERILPEWGGNCTKKHWDKCSHLREWSSSYPVDKKRPELGFKKHVTNCTVQPPLCLHNGWTVTRCQLLCMRCNREILSKYDKYVRKEGAC